MKWKALPMPRRCIQSSENEPIDPITANQYAPWIPLPEKPNALHV
jgi:hypothetical protein